MRTTDTPNLNKHHSITYVFSAILATTVLACEPPMISEESGEFNEEFANGTDDTESDTEMPDSVFAEIRCVEFGLAEPLCLGRPVGSVDAWVIVASEQQLDMLVESGDAVDVQSWGADSNCAAGQVPSNFMPEYRCLHLVEDAVSVCMSGDGQWWTQVDRCASLGDDKAWSQFQCDGAAGAVGEHPWDAVWCHDTESGSCMGSSGVDKMWVWPTCWVAMWPEVTP